MPTRNDPNECVLTWRAVLEVITPVCLQAGRSIAQKGAGLR